MLGLAVLIFSTWLWTLSQADPEKEALTFVQAIQKGDLGKVVRHYDGKTCRCPERGGWSSYLVYRSELQPNMAFLLAHPFTIGNPVKVPLQKQHIYSLPWQHPEDVIIKFPLEFETSKFTPIFLPLPLAYGHDMTANEFDAFLKNPAEQSGLAFTLRLRSSLKKGLLQENLDRVNGEVYANLPEHITASGETPAGPVSPALKAFRARLLKTALDAKQNNYIKPDDPGNVTNGDGTIMPPSVVEQKLPRLTSIVMSIQLVRNDQFQNWAILHCTFEKPKLLLDNGTKSLELTPSVTKPMVRS
jgi:hypothetical protein